MLEQLERLYSADGDLVKHNWRMHDQSLRLVTSSSVVEQMLPKLVKHLAKEAANISVVAQNLQGGSPILPLVENACDLVICTHKDELPAEIHSTAIEAGRFVCLVDQNVFELNVLDGESGLGNITFEQFLNHSHVVITQSEQLNHALDQGLAGLGHSRKVVAGLPNFDQALEILIDSDFVLTCPERLAAAALEKHKHLKVSPCPLDIAPLSISMMWHERSHDDVMMQWVRSQLLDTITKLSV
ncbi:MAG: LysR substrate-binding domain-containing protein [Pontibacterium sp.]